MPENTSTLTGPACITEGELIAFLSGIRGAKVLSLTTETSARLRKTGNLWGEVTKVSRVNVMVNFHYDKGVERRLESEGKSLEDFKRGESWHTPVLTDDGKLTPFCSHPKTGELYLRVQVLGRGETRYFTPEGVELTHADVEPWLPKSGGGYKNQGLEGAPLEFKVYKVASVLEVTTDGETYSVAK